MPVRAWSCSPGPAAHEAIDSYLGKRDPQYANR
jgi:hypothetical protein